MESRLVPEGNRSAWPAEPSASPASSATASVLATEGGRAGDHEISLSSGSPTNGAAAASLSASSEPSAPQARMRSKKRLYPRSAGRILLPLLAGILFLVLWQQQLFHRLFHLRIYQLPLPSAIWEAIGDNRALLLSYTRYTLTEAIGGLLIGSAAGFVIAWIASAWPRWGAGSLLVVAALNAVPIVALAPIMNLWFSDGMISRMAIVAVTTMAAMAINAYKGMSMIDPLALDLMQACAAPKAAVYRYLRIPNSLPYVFTALKINTTASMIGAIVGEFFFSSRGLGYLLSNAIKVAKMPLGWSCIVVAALAGVLFYLLVEAIEKVFIRWHPSARS